MYITFFQWTDLVHVGESEGILYMRSRVSV